MKRMIPTSVELTTPAADAVPLDRLLEMIEGFTAAERATAVIEVNFGYGDGIVLRYSRLETDEEEAAREAARAAASERKRSAKADAAAKKLQRDRAEYERLRKKFEIGASE